jgi:hypothetical protein
MNDRELTVDTEFDLRLPASQQESAVHLFTPDLRGASIAEGISLLTPDNVAQTGWGQGKEAANVSNHRYRIE